MLCIAKSTSEMKRLKNNLAVRQARVKKNGLKDADIAKLALLENQNFTLKSEVGQKEEEKLRLESLVKMGFEALGGFNSFRSQVSEVNKHKESEIAICTDSLLIPSAAESQPVELERSFNIPHSLFVCPSQPQADDGPIQIDREYRPVSDNQPEQVVGLDLGLAFQSIKEMPIMLTELSPVYDHGKERIEQIKQELKQEVAQFASPQFPPVEMSLDQQVSLFDDIVRLGEAFDPILNEYNRPGEVNTGDGFQYETFADGPKFYDRQPGMAPEIYHENAVLNAVQNNNGLVFDESSENLINSLILEIT